MVIFNSYVKLPEGIISISLYIPILTEKLMTPHYVDKYPVVVS
jgi:hypothetical protein